MDMKEYRTGANSGYSSFHRDNEVIDCMRCIYHNLEEQFDDLSIPGSRFTSPENLVQTWVTFKNYLESKEELFTEARTKTLEIMRSRTPNNIDITDNDLLPYPLLQVNYNRHKTLDVLRHVLNMAEVGVYLTGPKVENKRKHVVFLLHGIRTQGEWAQRTASILESDPLICARPIRYEFFDVVRFLIPFKFLRDQPVRRIASLIRDEMSRKPESFSIVAHSFGTYVVAKILELEADIRFHRLILCGSIVPDKFNWERYGHRIDSDCSENWHVVNDCGMNDIWPVFAKSMTWGYGSSGRFGFGHPRVKDRFFNVNHSGFFSENFIRDYWLPYLSKGEIVEGILDRATTPWWVSVLTIIKLRNLVIILIVYVTSIHLFQERTHNKNVKSIPESKISELTKSLEISKEEGEIKHLTTGISRSFIESKFGPPVIVEDYSKYKIKGLYYNFNRFYLTVLTDKDSKAIYYSITSKDRNFKPAIPYLNVNLGDKTFAGVGREISGYVPRASNFSFPPNRYLSRQRLPPLAATRRNSPSPSVSL
jgi:pimeloyl-ACP methyl ester carboxylesterase